MAFTLRDYQADDVARLYDRLFSARAHRLIYRLGTGGGKTAVGAAMVDRVVAEGGRCLILVHKDFLLDQFLRNLDELDLLLQIDVVKGRQQATGKPIIITTIQTLHARPQLLLDAFDLIVMDECHHAAARTWREVVDRYPKTPILGLTATPGRNDNRGLGEDFDEIISGPTNRELVRRGYRAPIYMVDQPISLSEEGVKIVNGDYSQKQLGDLVDLQVIKQAIQAYERVEDEQIVFFGENIRHSQRVADALRLKGIPAAHIDGKTSSDERRRTFGEFGAERIQVICNADLLMEGLDVPTCSAVIMHRHTRSVTRYLQMAGRGARPKDGKAMTLVDGCHNNARHGHPDDERLWTLNMDAPINLDATPEEWPDMDLTRQRKKAMALAYETGGEQEKIEKLGAALGFYPEWAVVVGDMVRKKLAKLAKAA